MPNSDDNPTDSPSRPRTSSKDSWNSRFEELVSFKSLTGHCRVPTNFPSNPRLASWVSSQRKHYSYMLRGKASSMTRERVAVLEGIGFVWRVPRSGGVKPDPDRWRKYYDELKTYKKKHGHCKVPQRYAENPRLGVWVHMQRVNYKYRKEGDERSSMNEARIKELEEIGFVWQEENAKFKPDDTTWMQRYEDLRKFKMKHGHCRVPRGFAENPSLGNWVSSQRMHFKKYKEGKKSTITENRVRALEQIGFQWKKKNAKKRQQEQPSTAAEEEQENEENPLTNEAVGNENDAIMFAGAENDANETAQILLDLRSGRAAV